MADYRKDTAHLTPIEHYIYRSLIDWYYLDEMPIPKETQVVSRRLSLGKDDKANLENVLCDFFVLGDNGYVHGKIEEDLKLYRDNASKNQKNGKKGGRPKKTTATANPLETEQEPTETQSVNLDNPSESQKKPNYKPLTNNHKPITILKDKTQEKTKRFVPPSVDEIKAHLIEKDLTQWLDPIAFHSHYESNGWKVGKNKMKNWKSAVTTWTTKNKANQQGGYNGQTKQTNGYSTNAIGTKRIRDRSLDKPVQRTVYEQ